MVVGLGATGLSIARYLQRSDIDAMFFDSRDEPPGLEELDEIFPKAEVLLGGSKLPKSVQRIIASPGVADSHPLLVKARKKNIEVISDIELFARDASAPFVAVTGSNGKSTVTTLLYHMCRADGREVLAGGNLGEPALDLLGQDKPDVYVLELSSFQLQRTQKLPAQIAVLLNVSPDHLDWHTDEEEYRLSKYRVYRDAKAAVHNRADDETAKYTKHCDRVISFGSDAPADGHYGLRTDGEETYLACGETLLLSTNDLGMYGIHNQLNALRRWRLGTYWVSTWPRCCRSWLSSRACRTACNLLHALLRLTTSTIQKQPTLQPRSHQSNPSIRCWCLSLAEMAKVASLGTCLPPWKTSCAGLF